MTLLETALAVVLDGALGSWLGAIIFFSFVGAPAIFGELDRPAAGRTVGAIFPRYYRFGVILGVIAIVASLAHGPVSTLTTELFGAAAAAAIGVLLFSYSRWVLIPKMDQAGDEGFARYHRQSVILNGVTMLAVTIALIATHL